MVTSNGYAQSNDDEKYIQANRYYEAKEFDKAIPILNELVGKNHTKAMNTLGNCYYNGNGVNKDLKKSFELYQRSAKLGWAKGQFNIGMSYYYGEGVDQNYKQAVAWWTKAADQGLADAQHNLGVCYEKGQGTPEDYDMAFSYYKKAAAHGHEKSLNNLGWFYEKGLSVDIDLEKAIYYYEQAANKGNSQAMVNLGWLYLENEDYKNQHPEYGWEYFEKQAEKWFRLAAKENNPHGTYALAWFYYTLNPGGTDIWDRLKKATPLFEKAANMDSWGAQLFMGYASMREGNLQSAMNWFNKAEENGGKDSFGLSVTEWKTICGFFIKNSQYKFFWNNDCCSIDHYVYPEENYLYVGATLNGKFGFLKISFTGKILAHTPFIYEQGWPHYDKETKLFHVTLKKEGEEYGHDITIDITGKEI